MGARERCASAAICTILAPARFQWRTLGLMRMVFVVVLMHVISAGVSRAAEGRRIGCEP